MLGTLRSGKKFFASQHISVKALVYQIVLKTASMMSLHTMYYIRNITLSQ